MVRVPTPAAEGLKFPALTPIPLYVPPAGDPPVNAKVGVFKQTELFDGQVRLVVPFTVIWNVQVTVQPLLLTE